MTEDELSEAVGLVSRFYSRDANGNYRAMYEGRMGIQRRLLVLGVQLSHPLPADDPRAPPGGTTLAQRAA